MSLTPEELEAFRLAASAFLASTEQFELVADKLAISDSMRKSHFERTAAVLKPIISCWRRTGVFVPLRFRGWIFRAGPADLEGTRVDLVVIREESIEDVPG